MVLESAVTGEQLLVLEVAEGETCEDLKRAVGWRLNHPTFAIHVVNASGAEVAELATWASIGCPSVLGILLRPRTTSYTANLVQSVLEGDADGVKRILEAGQEPDSWINIPGRFKEPVLHSAIAYDREDCVKVLLQGFASPSIVGWNRRSALHLAALKSKPELVNLLILSEADIHAHDTFGQTPLHAAAYANCVETVRCLLAAKADALASDMDGETPLEPGMNSDARCDLMNSCWHRLRPVDVFQLALLDVCNMLPGMRLTQLKQLCRPVHRQLQFYYGGHTDVQGGSAAHLDMGCFAGEVEQCNETGSKKRKVQAPVEHNRIVAKFLRDFRRNGKLLAPVTSALNLLDCTSLQGVSLQPLLPCQLRSGYIQRSIMPAKPTCWPAASPEVIDHLRLVNAHPLDQHLSFEALSHTYFWHGCRVNISATGLIHRFSHGFDPAQALALMRNGNQWPRPKYLRSSIPASLLSKLRALDYASELLSMLSASPPPAEDICKLVRHCIAEHPQDKDLLLSVAKSDSEILQQWKNAAEVGASQGTWMHTSFECLLNGGFVTTHDHEMALCVLFLRAVMDMGAVIYRTEWMIYAEVEDLAGSIDLVLKLPNSKLILVDWKRTQSIQSKCQSFGRNMLDCLQDVPDCTLWHYRLQLNVYRHILQKYYTQEVSMMFIVGCHPDNGESPFVENVCVMEEQTIALFKTLEGRDPTALLQDCLGGGCSQDIAAVWLGHFFLCWPVGSGVQTDEERLLREFQKALRPVWPALSAHPHLFWVLPNPLSKGLGHASFLLRVTASSFFMQLLQERQLKFLELALYVFFWPEIKSRLFIVDMIFVSGCFEQEEDCARHMAETIHFLHDCWLSCAADAWRQQVTQRWRSLEVLQSLSKVLAVQRDVRSVLFQQAKTCSCRALFPQQHSFFDMDLLRASEFSKEVKAVVAECSTVLASHNQLRHLLLASSYTCLGHNAWRLRFYSARFFLLLLQDQEFDFLELALYIFHWPEIDRQPYLADCLLATMTSELRCSRCRHLANVIHTLHWASFLDRSSWEEPELSHREQSFCLLKSLFDSEMLRASLLRPPDKKLDACVVEHPKMGRRLKSSFRQRWMSRFTHRWMRKGEGKQNRRQRRAVKVQERTSRLLPKRNRRIVTVRMSTTWTL